MKKGKILFINRPVLFRIFIIVPVPLKNCE